MATITSVGSGLWSAAGTWDAGVPVDNDVVVIASGHTVEFDVNQSGFANGIDSITITGTLSLTRSAGTYYMKIKTNKTIAGAGTFDCGTSVSPIPFAAKHTITGGSVWWINGGSGLAFTVYAAEPVTKYVKLIATEPVAETVLAVDTDVTGDIWAAGDTIRIDNVNRNFQSEERTIAAGGIAAGTITITAGLTAEKLTDSLVLLISRNVNFIGNGTSGTNLFRSFGTAGKVTIGGGQFSNPIAGTRIAWSCVGMAISGGTFSNAGTCFRDCALISITGGVFSGLTYFLDATSRGSISGAVISGSGYALNACSGFSISDTLISGCGQSFISSLSIALLNVNLFGTQYPIFQCRGVILNSCVISQCTAGVYQSTAELNSVSLSANSTADIHTSQISGYNNLFSSTTEFTAYTHLAKETYSYSIDHDQVQGAFKAWTKGGITTKQAVTYPTGYTNAMQTVLEDANNEGYWQREVSVSAGQSVNFDLWFRKDEAMAYLPRCYVFLKRSTDPFAGGTPLKTFTMTDSIDTWEHDTYTYANDGTEDETLVVRFQGKNASGNMFSALTVDVLNVDLTNVLAHLLDIKGAGWTDENLTLLATSAQLAALNDLNAAEIRAALGLAAANLDLQFLNLVAWAAINLDESITAGTIIQIRGNSWTIAIEDLTLSAYKQQFAIKYTHLNASLNQSAPSWNVTSPDADSLVFIDSDTGLLYLNGVQAADPTLGSLVYAGTTLTVTLDPAATQLLAPGNYIFGIQSVDALGNVSEAYGGTFTITADVVRSIS